MENSVKVIVRTSVHGGIWTHAQAADHVLACD